MKVKNNPGRYSEMSKPRTPDELDVSIKAFYAELSELRVRHRLADVHVIVRVIVDVDGDDTTAFSVMHCGAIQEAEGMCAYAFANSAETRRRFVDGNKVIGQKVVA